MEHHQWASVLLAFALSAAGLGGAQARNAGDREKRETERTVTVLRDEDCGGPAVARLREVAAQLGVEVRIVEVIVRSQGEADKYRYLGSPTVQIEGLDIDPQARARTSFGMG